MHEGREAEKQRKRFFEYNFGARRALEKPKRFQSAEIFEEN